jgi:hypothetical protein
MNVSDSTILSSGMRAENRYMLSSCCSSVDLIFTIRPEPLFTNICGICA